MKKTHKKDVLIAMIKEVGVELRHAQNQAVALYNTSYNADKFRSAAHDRAMALIKEFEKIRKML